MLLAAFGKILIIYISGSLVSGHFSSSNAGHADRLWEIQLKENKEQFTVMAPPKKRPSNLPATVTVISNPLQHLIEISILWLGL